MRAFENDSAEFETNLNLRLLDEHHPSRPPVQKLDSMSFFDWTDGIHRQMVTNSGVFRTNTI